MEKFVHAYRDSFNILWTNPRTNVVVMNIPNIAYNETRSSADIMEFSIRNLRHPKSVERGPYKT